MRFVIIDKGEDKYDYPDHEPFRVSKFKCIIFMFIFFSHHKLTVKGLVVDDFNWFVSLILSKSPPPRMLIFFSNINTLADAYAYLSVHAGKVPGDRGSVLAMFHLNTLPELKVNIISDLGQKEN